MIWRPILVGALHKHHDRIGWGFTDKRAAGMREVERRAHQYELPPIHWPKPYPANSLTAMRAATHAANLGRGRAFAQAAYRLAFACGRNLTELAPLQEAGESCGIGPTDLADAVNMQNIKDQLRVETYRAAARGVIGVPTIAWEGQLWWGDDRLGEAAEEIRARLWAVLARSRGPESSAP